MKNRNLVAKDLLTSGLYIQKVVKAKKGKGSFKRKGKHVAAD